MTGTRKLVMVEGVNCEKSGCTNRHQDEEQEDCDEPCRSIGCLWGWLGDAKGVDKGIREKEQRFHGF